MTFDSIMETLNTEQDTFNSLLWQAEFYAMKENKIEEFLSFLEHQKEVMAAVKNIAKNS